MPCRPIFCRRLLVVLLPRPPPRRQCRLFLWHRTQHGMVPTSAPSLLRLFAYTRTIQPNPTQPNPINPVRPHRNLPYRPVRYLPDLAMPCHAYADIPRPRSANSRSPCACARGPLGFDLGLGLPSIHPSIRAKFRSGYTAHFGFGSCGRFSASSLLASAETHGSQGQGLPGLELGLGGSA